MSSPGATLQSDFTDGISAGNQTDDIAAAAGVAAGYGILMCVAIFNFIRERHGSHILLVLFGASKSLPVR